MKLAYFPRAVLLTKAFSGMECANMDPAGEALRAIRVMMFTVIHLILLNETLVTKEMVVEVILMENSCFEMKF